MFCSVAVALRSVAGVGRWDERLGQVYGLNSSLRRAALDFLDRRTVGRTICLSGNSLLVLTASHHLPFPDYGLMAKSS